MSWYVYAKKWSEGVCGVQLFVADHAGLEIAFAMFGEAIVAEEAVTVKDEFADVAEAVLAFVAVLGLLVHWRRGDGVV